MTTGMPMRAVKIRDVVGLEDLRGEEADGDQVEIVRQFAPAS